MECNVLSTEYTKINRYFRASYADPGTQRVVLYETSTMYSCTDLTFNSLTNTILRSNSCYAYGLCNPENSF